MKIQHYRGPGAYVIKHVKSGRVYIGSAKDLYTRLHTHLSSLKSGIHHRPEFVVLFKDDERLEITYYKTDDREQAYAIEDRLLREYREADFDSVMNVAEDVKLSQLGLSRSDATKLKIGIANTGKARTDVHIENMRRGQLGRKHTPEDIEKTRQAHLGSKRTVEQKAFMRSQRKDTVKVMVDGSVYFSVSEASRILNVARATVVSRANNPNIKNWSFVTEEKL